MAAKKPPRKFRRWDVNTFSLSSDNLSQLNKMLPLKRYEPAGPYSRPIAFSKYPLKNRKRNTIQISNFDVMKQTQPRGLIFVWPQRKKFQREEYTTYFKIISHLFYWLDQLGFFPRGTGIPSKRPPWEIMQPLKKPENRDYIIEPDWNSVFVES